jgi:hypothetical protein
VNGSCFPHLAASADIQTRQTPESFGSGLHRSTSTPGTNVVTSSVMATISPDIWNKKVKIDTASFALTMPVINNYYVATCNWKDKIYGLTASNKLYAINPTTNTRTLISDLSEDTNWAVRDNAGNTTFTTGVDGDGSWNLKMQGSPDFPAGCPWRRHVFGLRVKVLNYNGTPGSVRYGWAYDGEDDGNANIRVWDEVSNAYMTDQPAGTQFKLFWNWINCRNGNDYAYLLRLCHMFVHGGKLYWLGLSSRTPTDGNAVYDFGDFWPRWTLSVWDGTGAVNTTNYLNGSSYFSALGAQYAIDTVGNELHVLSYNHESQVIEHRKFGLTSPYPMTFVASVYPRTAIHDTEWTGMIPDGVVAFDQTDVDANDRVANG